jgi:hypothetical protein
MQPSECCIIRASIAASLGAVIAFLLLLSHGLWVAAVLSPFFGSAAAIGAVALFWFVSRFIPCEADVRPTAEAPR